MKQNEEKQSARKLFAKTASAFLLSHIGGIIIAFIFCFGLSSLFQGNGIYVLIPVILFVYSYPVYGTMWNAGHRDLNAANFGHTVLHRWKGLVYGVAGMIPVIVISLAFILSKFGLLFNFIMPYKIINAEIWPIINLINTSIYLPDFSYGQVFLIALCSLIPVLIGEFGYVMGTYDISIKQKLVYRKEKSDKHE